MCETYSGHGARENSYALYTDQKYTMLKLMSIKMQYSLLFFFHIPAASTGPVIVCIAV